MSLEFVWLYSPLKNINKSWFDEEDNVYGSLIEKPIKSTKSLIGQGNDLSFILSNRKDKSSLNSFFDGNCIYNEQFSLEYSPQVLDDYLDFIYKARGTFCIAFGCELEGKRVARFSNDTLGMYPLLYWSDGENVIVTNNPLLAEEVAAKSAGITLKRTFNGVANEIVAFAPLNQGPFENMKLLAFDSEVIVDDKGKLSIKRKFGDNFFYKAQESEEELYKQTINELLENINCIANASQKVKIADITGGFDSRLVLALILKANVQDSFYFNTHGIYPNPDANVANYIIKKYKLKKVDMKSIPNQRVGSLSSDVLYELSTFAYATSGMKNTLDRHLSSLVSNHELLRVGGGYSAYKDNQSKGLARDGNFTVQDGVDLLCKGDFSLPSDLLETTKRTVSNMLEFWTEKQGMSLYDALDRYHIEHRTRFSIGLCEHWSRICQPKMHPLQSPALVRLAFKVGYDSRYTDKLLFKLMERLEPSLCLIPFDQRTWQEEAYEDSDLKVKVSKVKPITWKSKNIYGDEPPKMSLKPFLKDFGEVINGIPQGQASLKIPVKLSSLDKKWEASQRSLGRKWHWYKLGEIKSVFNFLLVESLTKEDDFAWMLSLKNKDLKDFKNIKEVIELHVLTTFLIFYSRNEVPLRVSW